MKWFKTGLDKESLNKEYKRLAKIWHPDVCKEPDAAEKMKEINDEYDKYYIQASYAQTGYNAEDIETMYKKARSHREFILAFLRRDRMGDKSKWFGYTPYGRIVSDDSESWNDFKGGFAVIRANVKSERPMVGYMIFAEKELADEHVSRIPGAVEFPSYGDMYFAMKFGDLGKNEETTDISTRSDVKVTGADIDEYNMYNHIRHPIYGDMWIYTYRHYYGLFYQGSSRTYAFMKAQGQILKCQVNLNGYETIESVPGSEFGMKAFQDCTIEEFEKYHDTEYNRFHNALECEQLRKSNYGFWQSLYWIDDPVVAHFARLGVVTFFQSKRNFRLRYGIFNMRRLLEVIHLLDIDDAEHIQDYLDDLRNDFEDHCKSMIKKGKIRVVI